MMDIPTYSLGSGTRHDGGGRKVPFSPKGDPIFSNVAKVGFPEGWDRHH